jgi:serine/threonine protein kinase
MQATTLLSERYEVTGSVARGGMAHVFRGVSRAPVDQQRHVAVKRLLPNFGGNERFQAMFLEEARVVADLQHPNIASFYELCHDDGGMLCIVMEWVDGVDLSRMLLAARDVARPVAVPDAAFIATSVLKALSAAHRRASGPVFHRDVTPANILVSRAGEVKLTDFGLARAMDRASMTRPNVIKGKLAYCAPELITGAKANARTDIFGLGVVIWEALAQKRLFTGKNDLEVLLAVRKGAIPPLTGEREDLPAALDEVIQQSLAQNPEERYQTAKEMARALASVLRSTTEHTDAEPLGASVRAARARLGKDPATSAGGTAAPNLAAPQPNIDQGMEEPEKSSEDLSMSDVEVVEVELRQKKPVDRVPTQPLPVEPAVRGLWDGDDKSVALPLTRKKDE